MDLGVLRMSVPHTNPLPTMPIGAERAPNVMETARELAISSEGGCSASITYHFERILTRVRKMALWCVCSQVSPPSEGLPPHAPPPMKLLALALVCASHAALTNYATVCAC